VSWEQISGAREQLELHAST